MVPLTLKPVTETDQPIMDQVRLVSQAMLGDSPGPLIGFAPANRLSGYGLPWASRKVAVVWGWHFPTCVMPCRGRKPLGSLALDQPNLDGVRVELRVDSRRRVAVSTGDLSLAIVRLGRLTAAIEDGSERMLMKETSSRLLIDDGSPPAALSLGIGLWAADQMRGVWSIWRHVLNGI